ncbi:AraC family transcriptional regulator [Methylobacterium phyllostachyos]|nr:AraC family transcriptional regulator [Methylobacterium phyllostachyos]
MPEALRRAMTVGTIRATVLARVVRNLDARSGQADALLHEVGLNRGLISDDYSLVSLKSYARFFDRAAAELGDRWFGLRLGTEIRPVDLGPIGALMSNASTLSQGLDDLCRHIEALQSATAFSIHRRGAQTHLTYRITDPTVGPAIQDAEFTLSATCNVIRSLIGSHWSPIELHLRHPAPQTTAIAQQTIGAPVVFGNSLNSIVLRSADLALAPLNAQPDLRTFLERHVLDLIQEKGSHRSTAERVDAVIALLLPHGVPTLARVAGEIGWSARSLQRALTDEGTSLRTLVQQHRHRVAQAMLEERTHSHAAIAHALGYADATVFWRAYKSWTGSPPSGIRKGH